MALLAPCADEPINPALYAPVSSVEEMLAGVNPDELTPREALELLYRLRKELTD